MKIITTVLLLCITLLANAQEVATIHDYTIIKPAQWVIPENDTISYTMGDYDSAKALLLKRSLLDDKRASVAYPKDLVFSDGSIEADIASPAGGAGYIGVAFHIKDAQHYETVYFRPGLSHSMEAMQYMPERSAEFNWWSYTDHKFQARATLPLTQWFHVQLLVKGSSLTVFVNNDPKPVFTYHYLDTDLDSGSAGFWLGNCTAGAYKNLVIKATPKMK